MIRSFARRFCTVNPLAIQGNFSFEVVTKEKDAARFIDLISDQFSRREATATSVGCSKEDMHTAFDSLGEYFLKHQSALIARDNSIGDIVSGLIGMDYCYEFPPEFESRLSPKCQEVVQILDRFKNKNNESGHFTKEMNTYFYIYAGFTVDAYEGRGLYRMLSNLAEKRAREKGFKYMVRETTNSRLAKAFAKQGYQILIKESFEEVAKFVSKSENGTPYWMQLKKPL